MANQAFIHRSNDTYTLLIGETSVPQDELINVFGSIKTSSNSLSVIVTDLNVTTIDLMEVVFSVDKAETFWDVSASVHGVHVMHQVRSDVPLVLHLINLNDLVGIPVLFY